MNLSILQPLLEYLFELFQFRHDHVLAVGLFRVQPEVILMIVFSNIEGGIRLQRGDNRLCIYFFFREPFYVISSLFTFRFITVENGGTILCPYIITLSIKLGRIMCCKKRLKQLVIRNYFRTVNYLDGLRMTRPTGSHLLIRWVGHPSADVPRDDRIHTFKVLELGLSTPKTASCKDCRIDML